MENIKYKVWRIMSEEWLDCLVMLPSGRVGPISSNGDVKPWPDKDVVVCLFTGLRDRRGIDIYEGDIVRIYDEPYWDEDWIEKYKGNAVVEWVEEGCEYWASFSEDSWLVLRGDDWNNNAEEIVAKHLEIIGNKFENKDLCNT